MKEGNVYLLEGIVFSYNEERMIIWTMNDEGLGIVVPLPFITGVKGHFIEQIYRTPVADK